MAIYRKRALKYPEIIKKLGSRDRFYCICPMERIIIKKVNDIACIWVF